MASNAARKVDSRQDLDKIDNSPESIRQKKEGKLHEIEQIFEAVKDRAIGKGEELTKMQTELTDLLSRIPDQESGEFHQRLADFARRFRDVKKHLDSLQSEEKFDTSPSGAFELDNIHEVSNADEPPPVPESTSTESEGKLFNGVVDLSNGDRYNGFAIRLPDGSYRFEGEGTLEKSNGLVIDGVFKNGQLKDGHLYNYFDDNKADIQFVKDGKVVHREMGMFDRDLQLLSGVVLDPQSGKVLETVVESAEGLETKGNVTELPVGLVNDFKLSLPDDEAIAVLNGIVNDKGNDEKAFQGKIEFKNYDDSATGFEYTGEAVILQNKKIKYEGHGILTNNHEIAKGQWKNGELVDGQIRDKKTGKLIEARRNGNSISLVGRAVERVANFLKGFGKKEKAPQTADAFIVDKGGEESRSEVENEDESQKARDVSKEVSKLKKLENFIDAYGQVLNGKLTHTKDGKHIFEGKIEHPVQGYAFEGKAILNKDGMFEIYNEDLETESEPGKEKTKEEGRLGRMAEAVFAKTVGNDSARKAANILGQVGYRGGAALFGAKIATDAILLGVAKGLEKAGQTSVAKAVGEYSDQYKYFRGSAQIKEIKAGFENFIATIGVKEKSTDGDSQETEVDAEHKEFLGVNLVNEKYDALKAKIEAADQLDPEAKAKLMTKLESFKQNFDQQKRKLEEEELQALQKATEAYLVKKVAGMQITRDAFNAAFTVAGLQYVRAGFMGISKVKERMDKNNIFNLQAELEGKKEIGMIKDFGIALLETASGLTGGCFGLQKKDLKTGKELTGATRFANAVKEIGNVFVAIGVGRLAMEETSHFQEVFRKFADNVSHAKGGEFAHNWMVNAEKQMHFIAHPIDSVKESWDKATADKAHAAAHGKAPILHKGAEIKQMVASSPAEHKTPSASSETIAAAAVAGSGEAAVAGTSVESSGSASASAEILGAKDISKVHDFGSWRRQMMESMGYRFHGGKIDHALLFHKGAKIELVAADGKIVDTYTFKQGGSTWAAMDKFHRDHAELFKSKDSVPGIRIIDTGDAKHATVKVLDHYKVESHQGAQTNFKEGGAVAKTTLDKVISDEKLSKVGLHDQKISLGSNLQNRIPSGWALSGKDGPKGALTVNGLEDAQGSAEKFLIHATGTDHEFNVDKDMRWVDIRSGKIFNLDGDHVGNLNSEKIVSAASATEGGRIAWSNGGNVSEKVQKELVAHIVSQPAEKEAATQSVAKTERSEHGGSGAPKESVVRAETPTEEALPQQPITKTRVEAKPVVNPVETRPQAPMQAEVKDGKVVQAETQLLVHEVTSLTAAREAVASLDYLDETEKMRLDNFSYLLEWQKDLYGENGSNLSVLLKDHEFGVLGREEIDSAFAKLAKDQESAAKQFMKAIQDKQPLNKILGKLSEKMPGYLELKNSDLADKVLSGNLSADMAKNSTAFKNMEVERVGSMFDQMSVKRFEEIFQR